MQISEHFVGSRKIFDRPRTSDQNNKFIDFAKYPSLNDLFPETHQRGILTVGKKGSRFTDYAVAEVVYVNEIHEEIISGLSGVQNLDQTGPSFQEIDLARLISRVIVNLNLKPASGRNSLPEISTENTISELVAKLNLQNSILTELGKSMQLLSKYNDNLIKINKSVIQQKERAFVERDELLKLYQFESSRNNSFKIDLTRQFFDEAKLYDDLILQSKALKHSDVVESQVIISVESDLLSPPIPHQESPAIGLRYSSINTEGLGKITNEARIMDLNILKARSRDSLVLTLVEQIEKIQRDRGLSLQQYNTASRRWLQLLQTAKKKCGCLRLQIPKTKVLSRHQTNEMRKLSRVDNEGVFENTLNFSRCKTAFMPNIVTRPFGVLDSEDSHPK